MQAFKTTIVVASLAALAGCGSLEKNVKKADLSPICPKTHGWQPWADDRCNPPPEVTRDFAAELAAAQKQNSALGSRMSDLERQLADRDREIASLRSGSGNSATLASQLSSTQGELTQSQQRADSLAGELAASQALTASLQAGAGDKDKLAADLAAANQRIAELEKQLTERDKELAGLRSELSTEMAKLNEAQRGLVRALRPEIEQGNITVDLNNERLLINLTSSMLFGEGEDQLKPAGTDALKRVGAILKGYPEYKVEVDGHTDNLPIRSSLKKRFPTNKELSEARATNGVTALAEGGVSAGTITSAGYADTKPVAPNATDEGRQKNRRVEVRVTPKS